MTTSRRKFLKTAATAAAGFYIVPRHVLGRGYTPPSDKLNLAAIGSGGKGASDIGNAWHNGANNVVALCDVDWKYAQKTAEKFPDAKRYTDFREMLDKEKGIDAVTISSPDHTHAVAAMAAMQLGKHVYVQKPLTHNIYETRMLTETARKNKLVTQMGNQGASSPSVKQMIDWYEQGLIGKVHTVHTWTNRPVWPQGIPVPGGQHEKPTDLNWDSWIGPADPVDYNPAYHPFKWRGWWAFGTGALGDMGCHILDMPFRILGLGYPTEVEASVGSVFLKDWTPEWIPEGCPPSASIQLKFPATRKNKLPVTMTWSDGGIRPFHPDWIPANDYLGEEDSSNGVLMIGTKGVMSAGIFGRFAKIYTKRGVKYEKPELNAFPQIPEYAHQVLWAEACKAGFDSPQHRALTSSFDFSGPLTEAVLMGNLAIRSYGLRTAREKGGFDYPGRKKLLWDGVNMKITNFDAANQFVKREYRKGWSL
jgi:predicted dehydrogenase